MENVLTRISKFFIRRSVRGRKLPTNKSVAPTGNILVYYRVAGRDKFRYWKSVPQTKMETDMCQWL